MIHERIFDKYSFKKMVKYIICLSFVITSCDFSSRKEREVTTNITHKDTLILYNIEGISTEGVEAKVHYSNSEIAKSITNVYACTWQATIIHEFGLEKIKVTETKYFYTTEIENVQTEEDLHLDYEIVYFIDFEGNLIDNEINDRIDIFREFKETVPFELK